MAQTPEGPDLQQFGYRQELSRSLSFTDLLIYGLIFMVPIAPFGIFGSVCSGSGGMVALAYVVGMVAMMFTALSYAQMVRAFPMAGSVYSYAGRGIAPPVGFGFAWLGVGVIVLIVFYLTGRRPSLAGMSHYLNPVTGPVHVDGAEPGDTLAVHFVEIVPARDWAVSSTFPHFGTHTTATLHPPLDELVWRYDVDVPAGTVRYQARRGDHSVELPLDPMHGTAGVAPAAFESRMTIVPDVHGGNMDTPELRAGVTAYFGVNVPGALFALGDGHCRQGHGEVCGTGVEAAMNTVVILDVIKGVPTPTPRFETDTALMSAGSARPLEDAYRMSQHDLVTWTADLAGLDVLDAYQLISQAGEAPVGNVCDPNYTMLAKVDKRYLGRAAAYDGAHARLRETAHHYRSVR